MCSKMVVTEGSTRTTGWIQQGLGREGLGSQQIVAKAAALAPSDGRDNEAIKAAEAASVGRARAAARGAPRGARGLRPSSRPANRSELQPSFGDTSTSLPSLSLSPATHMVKLLTCQGRPAQLNPGGQLEAGQAGCAPWSRHGGRGSACSDPGRHLSDFPGQRLHLSDEKPPPTPRG